jgi:hypothetical protein
MSSPPPSPRAFFLAVLDELEQVRWDPTDVGECFVSRVLRLGVVRPTAESQSVQNGPLFTRPIVHTEIFDQFHHFGSVSAVYQPKKKNKY